MDQASVAPDWNPVQKVFFRFVFVYLVLFNLPFPLNVLPIPGLELILKPFSDGWSAFVIWVGKHVLHVTATVHPTGSGDTMLAYVEVFSILVLSVIAAGVWTLLDRKRSQYVRLHEWLRVYVRFSLATAMLSYGADKVIQSQFLPPGFDRLIQTFGEASPMGLLWTFMGASKSYNVFSGLAEMAGGLLLLTRRTTLLGALVCFAALSNVVMLNFSYDVPVKLYSLHLLAMAVFLAAPDLRRLVSLFVLNRPVPAAEIRPLFRRPWPHRGALALRTVFLVGMAGFFLFNAYRNVKTYGDLAPRPPFYGIWEVEDFALDGQVRPPLLTDPERWRRVVFSYAGVISIQRMSDRKAYPFTESADTKGWVLTKYDNPRWTSPINYQQPEPGILVLDGTYDGKRIHARLCKTDTSKIPLVSRGFHWISEYPFNR
jgi:hypothetical protein